MAKTSLIQRELKRTQLVAKYAKLYSELKTTANNAKVSDEERYCSGCHEMRTLHVSVTVVL